jgi:hypothetical protein
MNIIFTVLVAVPIGFFVRGRGRAILTFLALDAILFTFQTLSVLLDWLGPTQGFDGTAFGPKPTAFPATYSNDALAGYGLVNLVVLVVGVGLVVLGSYLARRRAVRRTAVAVG